MIETWEDGAHAAIMEIARATNLHKREDSTEFAKRLADLIRHQRKLSTTSYLYHGRYALDVLGFSYGEIVEILAEKQRKYGPDNILGFGHEGIAIRMHDKCARIINCAEFDELDDENPFFDLLGYCVVGIMLERGWFELPLRKLPTISTTHPNVEFDAEGEPLVPLSYLLDPEGVWQDSGFKTPTAGLTEFESSNFGHTATSLPLAIRYADGLDDGGTYHMVSYVWSGGKIKVEYDRVDG